MTDQLSVTVAFRLYAGPSPDPEFWRYRIEMLLAGLADHHPNTIADLSISVRRQGG